MTEGEQEMDDIKQVIEDLCLVDGVIPDYTLGRRRGFTDEETEKRAREAVSKAIEALEKQIPKKPIKSKNEVEKLKADLRGKDNEINDLKALVDYLRQFRPNKEEVTTQG